MPMLQVLGPQVAYATEIFPDRDDSWKYAITDGTLSGDTIPVVEGTGSEPWRNNFKPAPGNISGIATWDFNVLQGSETINPWKPELGNMFANHPDYWDWEENSVHDAGIFEGVFPGAEFAVDNQGQLIYQGVDYTKVSPLATSPTQSTVEFPGIGTWKLPTPVLEGGDAAQNPTNYVSTFEPAPNYAGPIPALPVYVSNGDGTTKLEYLTTNGPTAASYTVMMSSKYGTGTQTASTSGAGIFNQTLRDGDSSTWQLAYTYGLLDSNAAPGTEATQTLKKDGGTYSVSITGVVSFTPDPDFKDFGAKLGGREAPNDPGRLEGVEVVVTSLTGEKLDANGNQIIGETTPLYQLPKDNTRRS